MAENIPPGSAGVKAAAGANNTTSTTTNTATTDRPGLPYYEKLRRDLRDTINKKRILDRNMAAIEEQIFRQETAYLEETSVAGNIVKGFDNYIKASTASSAASAGAGTISGSAAGGTRRKAAVNDTDRVFSKSSVNYNRDSSDTPSSAVSTPGPAAGTPTAAAGGSFTEKGQHGDKKKKKAAALAAAAAAANNHDDGDTDSRATKRQKITFGHTGRKGHDD